MEKIKKAKIIWFSAACLSAALCVAAVCLMFSYGLHGKFVHLAVCIPFVLHGFWGTPVYVYNFFKARVFQRICFFLNEKDTASFQQISEGAGIRMSAIQPVLQKCIRNKYVKGFKIDTDRVVKAE